MPQVPSGQYCLNTALLVPPLVLAPTVKFQPLLVPLLVIFIALVIDQRLNVVWLWPFNVTLDNVGRDGAVVNATVVAIADPAVTVRAPASTSKPAVTIRMASRAKTFAALDMRTVLALQRGGRSPAGRPGRG